MPWECTEGRPDPMDDQVLLCSQTPRLESITHSTDVTWAGASVPASSTPQSSCSFLTSFGNFSHKNLGGIRESLTSCWSQRGGQEGQEAQDSWFQSRSLPVQAMWFILPLSWCLPGLIHARRSREGNSPLWDANAQGFSAEVPDPNQGLFSC